MAEDSDVEAMLEAPYRKGVSFFACLHFYSISSQRAATLLFLIFNCPSYGKLPLFKVIILSG